MNMLAVPTILMGVALASSPPPDALTAGARLARPEQMKKGASNTLVVRNEMKEGWSPSTAGIPNVIVQVKSPASVKLTGERETNLKKLSRAEFLRLPDERLSMDGKVEFPFEFVADPKPNERFEINLLAYVTNPDESDVWFVRKRIALPLTTGAESQPIDARDSSWGVGDELELGDHLPQPTLPRLEGEPLDLNRFIGKSNIVITTYRAYW